jgi:threonine aldolase
VETNIVFFDVTGTGLAAPTIAERLRQRGIRIGATNRRLMRAVTHLDVDRAGVEAAIDAVRQVVTEGA